MCAAKDRLSHGDSVDSFFRRVVKIGTQPILATRAWFTVLGRDGVKILSDDEHVISFGINPSLGHLYFDGEELMRTRFQPLDYHLQRLIHRQNGVIQRDK